MARLALAALHLLALGIGLGAVFARGRALRELPGLDAAGRAGAVRRAFTADAAWGVAALLWVGTGLWRYLGATEKATAYYNGNHIFLTKMALFGLIVALELSPMATLMRWRRAFGQRDAGDAEMTAAVDPTAARRIAAISGVQGVLVVLMVFAAVAMARGYGARG